MQTGQRGAQRPAPGNVTGMRFYQQQREQEVKKKAKENPVDINEVRRAEYLRGHADGYVKGLEGGWDACMRALVAEGVLDADESGESGDEPEEGE